ncbi:MAG: LysM peptidoglycan-binding domain-containing protein [Pseudomonadota bacterium]
MWRGKKIAVTAALGLSLYAIPAWALTNWTDVDELNAVTWTPTQAVRIAPYVREGAVEPRVAAVPSDTRPPPGSLWPKLRDGFGFSQFDHERVTRRTPAMRDLLRLRGEITRATGRAEPYLAYVLERVIERGLPTEIALLPFIESGFDPFARSPKSATGIWQFMPATARQFGLQRTPWMDERRDIVRATDAALDYVEYLYKRLGHDWLLAMAAYNCGEGHIRRARRRAGSVLNVEPGNSIFWAIQQYLPKETRRYVPRLLAWAAVIKTPARYRVRLAPLRDESYFERVSLDAQIDLQTAASLAGASLKEVKRLNAGLRTPATPPNGPHELLLPRDRIATFESQLVATRPSGLAWVGYTEKRPDAITGAKFGLPAAAAKAVRYHGVGKRLTRSGQFLGLPPGDALEYEVQSGDSLWKVAKRFSVRRSDLASWNGLPLNSHLRTGQKLQVWLLPPQAEPHVDGHVPYVVREGDSLWVIAQRFDVSVKRLRRSNALPNNGLIRPGQTLQIPES